jgi:hypothetical protein
MRHVYGQMRRSWLSLAWESFQVNSSHWLHRFRFHRQGRQMVKQFLQAYPKAERNFLRRYFSREKLPPALKALYQQTVREVRGELAAWINPWMIPPPCYHVRGMNNQAFYEGHCHEIWVCYEDATWMHFADTYLFVLERLLASPSPEEVSYAEEMFSTLRSHAALIRERPTTIDERYIMSIGAAWEQFEQELAATWHTYQEQHESALLRDHVQSLQQFQSFLRKTFHWTMVHELVHAWAKDFNWRKKGRFASPAYRAFLQYDFSANSKQPSLSYQQLNEAVTEWIASRVYAKVQKNDLHSSWQGLSVRSGYPFWIIEKLVLALDRHWSRMTNAIPSLARFPDAAALLYTIYFQRPVLVTLLQQALAVLSGDDLAFEKLALACERFYRSHDAPRDAALVLQAYQDVRDLLFPYLNAQERMISMDNICLYADEHLDGNPPPGWKLVQAKSSMRPATRRVGCIPACVQVIQEG